jgi:hypothetical protein
MGGVGALGGVVLGALIGGLSAGDTYVLRSPTEVSR